MSKTTKTQSGPVDAYLECKNPACRKRFKPKRPHQKFCKGKCKDELNKRAHEIGLDVLLNQKEKKTMRYAALENSKRLQYLLRALRTDRGYTSMELRKRTRNKVEAVHTGISEIRVQLRTRVRIPGFQKYVGGGIDCSYNKKKKTYAYKLIMPKRKRK